MRKKLHIIDTNFILRYLLADNPSHFKEAELFFDSVRTGEKSAILKDIVLTEVIFTLASFYKVPRTKITETLSQLILYKGMIVSDRTVLLTALEIYGNTNLHIVDSILAAETKINKYELLTFDKALKNLKIIRQI